MSSKTSHRRRAARQRKLAPTGGVRIDTNAVTGANITVRCTSTCSSQCDDCHDLDNCVEATHRYGDLLLCAACRKSYPVGQPWRIDPETGEYIDNNGVRF